MTTVLLCPLDSVGQEFGQGLAGQITSVWQLLSSPSQLVGGLVCRVQEGFTHMFGCGGDGWGAGLPWDRRHGLSSMVVSGHVDSLGTSQEEAGGRPDFLTSLESPSSVVWL